MTAMLFRWFAEERVDVALVEVGLGGRLDATHAWDGGVAAITNVALDHMAWLGDTIPAIAREKAAIIERGDLAVTGATGEALAVIRRRARRVGAPLTEVATPALLGWDRDGIDVELAALGPTRISLRGRHQADNAAVADAVLDALEAAGHRDGPARGTAPRLRDARRGPAGSSCCASKGRDVLLDGAHNPAGAAALATALDDLRPFLAGGRRVRPRRPSRSSTARWRDKDVAGIVAALAGSAALRRRAGHRDAGAGRARDARGRVAAAWRADRPRGVAVVPDPDVDAALDRALEVAGSAGGPVVVAGSLYLVGEARRRWLDDPLLRDPRASG